MEKGQHMLQSIERLTVLLLTLGLCLGAEAAAKHPQSLASAPGEVEAVEAPPAGAEARSQVRGRPCGVRLPTPATQEALSSSGPYGFATRDFIFVDESRPTPPNGPYPGAPTRTLRVRVWYPVCAPLEASPPPDTRVPVASGGPFPLLAYAHGLTSRGEPVRFVAEHMATHGYITVAPRFPLTAGDAPGGPTIADVPNQPGDLDFVMRQVAQLRGEDADLAAAVDPRRRGVYGLSAGGLTVLIAAYHPLLKIDIQAAVAYAPVSCFLGPAFFRRPLPTLLVAGTADELVPPEGPELVFELAPPPVTLVKLLGGTHAGFMNREQPYVENTDTRECALLLSADPTRGQTAFEEAITRGVGPDAINFAGCPLLCGERFRQTMGATRQLRLTRAATLAHFEATLRGRWDARLFLSLLLDRNNPDVEVRVKR